jgi:prepilin-type N-terminal cleavage/methylation domain-containing protein
MAPDPRKRAGFSLVELVLVLLLVGVMAGIVIPVLRPEGFQMNSAVMEVATTLMAQQRNAALRQHDVVLAFDTAHRRIRVHEDRDNDGEMEDGERYWMVELDEGIAFGRGSSPARPLSSDALSLAQSQDGLPSLTFHRNGSASEEAIVYLTSERSLVAGAFEEDGRAVEIERATGRVVCLSYAPGFWQERC